MGAFDQIQPIPGSSGGVADKINSNFRALEQRIKKAEARVLNRPASPQQTPFANQNHAEKLDRKLEDLHKLVAGLNIDVGTLKAAQTNKTSSPETTVPYKLGVQVLSPSPTGSGGTTIDNNFRALADAVSSVSVTVPLATESVSGLLSATDKLKLDQYPSTPNYAPSNVLSGLTTSQVSEGTNLYFTSSRAAAASPVQTVSGRIGTIVLNTSDINGLGSAAQQPSSAFAPSTILNGLTTTSVAEGTNLYFTSVRAAAAAPVQSVAGRTGTVTLSTTDISGISSYALVSSLNSYLPLTGGTITSNLTVNSVLYAGSLASANLYTPASNTTLTIQSQTFNVGTTALSLAPVTATNTSGYFYGAVVAPTYNQSSGTSNNTDLLIKRTQTAIGSGTQRLIDAQVNGVTQFNVDNAGNVSCAGQLTVSNLVGMPGGIGTNPGFHFNTAGQTYNFGQALGFGVDPSYTVCACIAGAAFRVASGNNTSPFQVNYLGQASILNSLNVGSTSYGTKSLTLTQQSSTDGFQFTGQSIGGGTGGTGFLLALGYNTQNNKQFWFGDVDYAGSASGYFARFAVESGAVSIDAVSGNGANYGTLNLGVAQSGSVVNIQGQLAFTAASTAPANTTTATKWISAVINGVSGKIPFFQ